MISESWRKLLLMVVNSLERVCGDDLRYLLVWQLQRKMVQLRSMKREILICWKSREIFLSTSTSASLYLSSWIYDRMNTFFPDYLYWSQSLTASSVKTTILLQRSMIYYQSWSSERLLRDLDFISSRTLSSESILDFWILMVSYLMGQV